MKLSSESQIDSNLSDTDSVTNASFCEDLTIVHCGTTTSNRGRMAEKGRNSLNVLQISSYDIVVTPHWLFCSPCSHHNYTIIVSKSHIQSLGVCFQKLSPPLFSIDKCWQDRI